jgi:hypothetical protein
VLDVHGPYVVTVVCEDQGAVLAQQVARTPEDGRELDMTCDSWLPAPISLTGTMVQPGMVKPLWAWTREVSIAGELSTEPTLPAGASGGVSRPTGTQPDRTTTARRFASSRTRAGVHVRYSSIRSKQRPP